MTGVVARTIGMRAGNRESGIGNRESGIGNTVIADYIANFVKIDYFIVALGREETSKPARADRDQ
ncbi:MAG: hypothetical protein F6K65_21295 [Moorea sp. SIO3C2]|nr:hypothetical protein [Moorena sp. SIO3C2]